MRLPALLIGLVLALGIAGCSMGSRSDSPRVLLTKENAKYQLICTFYGEKMQLGNGAATNVVKYLTIKSAQGGREVRFKPVDPSSLETSAGFFAEVWSPDQEFLVLPLGRFEGFAIAKSSEALQRLSGNTFNDFVRVQLKSGVRLWHEFQGWQGPSSFRFSAGLSGQQTPFMYDPPAHLLTSNTAGSDSFVGMGAQGALEIKFIRPQN
jgi:hypothetical protein